MKKSTKNAGLAVKTSVKSGLTSFNHNRYLLTR
jgi:hypothetical protein